VATSLTEPAAFLLRFSTGAEYIGVTASSGRTHEKVCKLRLLLRGLCSEAGDSLGARVDVEATGAQEADELDV
jgi:hypothetical protein